MKRITVFLLIVTLLLVVCFVFKPNVAYATTTYLSDTFETFTTGWTVGSGGTGVILKSGEQKHGGSFAAVVNCTTTASYAYGYKVVTSTATSNFHIGVWVYPKSGVNAVNIQLGGVYNTTVSKYNFKFGLNCSNVAGTGTFYLTHCTLDGAPGNWADVTPLTNDTWQLIDTYYIQSTGIVHYYVNSVAKGGDNAVLNAVYPERYYFGDTSGSVFLGKFWLDDLIIDDIAESVIDSTPPTYSSIGYSSTLAAQSCIFSCKWSDETALSGYIFGTNNTGTWTNETWAVLAGATAWANVTKTLNSTASYRIEFKWWCNDTSNNWNNTAIQFLVTTSHTVTFTFTYTGIRTPYVAFGYNGTLIANGTSLTFTNSTTTLRLEAYPHNPSSGETYELFEGWFRNGTLLYDSDLVTWNPVNLLINATYNLTLNFSEAAMIVPRFYIQNGTLQANETLGFNAGLSWAKTDIAFYSWDWGDTTTDLWQVTPTIYHTFTNAGTYNVTLTIFDNTFIGYWDSTIATITITEAPTNFVVWLSTGGLLTGISLFALVLVRRRRN